MNTPCEKLGYKVGDKFIVNDRVNSNYGKGFREGDIVTLSKDDGTGCPNFTNDKGTNYEYLWLDEVNKLPSQHPEAQSNIDVFGAIASFVKDVPESAVIIDRDGFIVSVDGLTFDCKNEDELLQKMNACVVLFKD